MGVAYDLQKHGERTMFRLEQAHQVEVDELEDRLKEEQELCDDLRFLMLDAKKPGWTYIDQRTHDDLVAGCKLCQERKTKAEEEEKEARKEARLARREKQLAKYREEAILLELFNARKQMKAQKAMKAMKAQKVMKAMKAQKVMKAMKAKANAKSARKAGRRYGE